jgi:hypothetical protein
MKTSRIPLATFAVLVALPLAIAGSKQVSKPLDHAASLAMFERIKKLDGAWRSRSTKGWEENQQFHVIAKGTAVTSESVPGANSTGTATAPLAPMLTVYHMDGDRLLLTHYCEAGNQPRMVATSVEDDGRTVHFSFLDATNLPSNSAGHMHSVVMTFSDDNHFSERWSWYQNGKEQWMETVQNERVTSLPSQP